MKTKNNPKVIAKHIQQILSTAAFSALPFVSGGKTGNKLPTFVFALLAPIQNFYRKSIAALAMSLAVCFIVLLPLQQGAAQSPLNVWRSAGPRANIHTVIVDQFNPNIIYAGGPNKIFKSIDNGANWFSLNLGGASDLSVDHINPNTIYAANEGVYKSTDGGETWINLNSPPASNVQVSPGDPNFIVAADINNNIFVTNNGGASWERRPFPAPFPVYYRDAFEIDPQNPNNIYTSIYGGGGEANRRSNDGGVSWTAIFLSCREIITAFKADPNNPNIVYASDYAGCFYKSTNGGANWTRRGLLETYKMAISPQRTGIIYAANYSGGGVRRSLDDGATWSDFSVGLSSQIIYDFAFDRSGRFLHAATAAGVFSVRVRPTENADFDGDGRSDISVFRPTDRVWYLNQSTNGFSATQFGLSTDKITPADYDGDGKTDIAVFRDGIWYLLRSTQGFAAIEFGLAGDVPVPADYTGDGRAELAIYRNGAWWIQNLTDNQTSVIQFGLATDKPVVGDYDGDGLADIAVFRRDGDWHLKQSLQGYAVVNFGLADDRPVPADYDGDGKTDPAVYRDGTWWILQSSNGATQFQWGISTDKPVPADYDGDGRTDIAVYRSGTWYIVQSSNGQFSYQQFGLSGDIPIAGIQ